MLLNGYLFNSEAWHAISEEDIKTLEKVDQHLLRSLVNGHAKTPIEFFVFRNWCNSCPVHHFKRKIDISADNIKKTRD